VLRAISQGVRKFTVKSLAPKSLGKVIFEGLGRSRSFVRLPARETEGSLLNESSPIAISWTLTHTVFRCAPPPNHARNLFHLAYLECMLNGVHLTAEPLFVGGEEFSPPPWMKM